VIVITNNVTDQAAVSDVLLQDRQVHCSLIPPAGKHQSRDELARRANHQKSVQTFTLKYFRCSVGQINGTTPAILSHQRGVGHRRKRGAGSGGRKGCD
jgi:hypothetical protein